MILADDFVFLLHKMVLTRGKGWLPLTTKVVEDVDNYELLADCACFFFFLGSYGLLLLFFPV